MKKAKKLLVIACLGGVGYLLVKALKIDAVREKLFEVMDEDLYLASFICSAICSCGRSTSSERCFLE